MKLGKPLTWDELAYEYDRKHHTSGRKARTLPMNKVFEWAEKQKRKFIVLKEGTVHKKDKYQGGDN